MNLDIVRAGTASADPVCPKASAALPRTSTTLSCNASIRAGIASFPMFLNAFAAEARTPLTLSYNASIRAGTTYFPIFPNASIAAPRTDLF